MRNTTISSSFASTIVAAAIDCVALTGAAVRTFLQLTSMRESRGYWLERCQSLFAGQADHHHGLQAIGKHWPGCKPGQLPRVGNSTLVLCPAPAWVVTSRVNRQG